MSGYGYKTSSGSGPWSTHGHANEWEEGPNYSSNSDLHEHQSSHATHDAWDDGMGDLEDICNNPDTFYGGSDRLQPGQIMSPKIPPRFDGHMSFFTYEELVTDWLDTTTLDNDKQGLPLRLSWRVMH